MSENTASAGGETAAPVAAVDAAAVAATPAPEVQAQPTEGAPETGAESQVAAEPVAAEAAPAETEAPAAETEADPAQEAVAEGDAPAGEGQEGDNASQFPTYEPFKLAEGLELAPEQTSALNNLMGKYGLSQEAAQEIVDFGSSVLKGAQERMAQAQRDAFTETRSKWVKEFEKDAGNRRETILNDAKSAIRLAFPNEKARTELWKALSFTGAGDHPLIIKSYAALGKALREREAPPPPTPADPSKNLSPAERRYGRRN